MARDQSPPWGQAISCDVGRVQVIEQPVRPQSVFGKKGIATGVMRYTVTLYKAENKGIGYLQCSVCKASTPPPPFEAIEHLIGNGDHWIWPFDDWHPEGWWILKPSDGEPLYVCPKCVVDGVAFNKLGV